MFPEHVDYPSKLGPVPFVVTDSEEEEENKDMLVKEEYDSKDMPQIEWNRDNPNLNAGAVYKNMTELWNALTMCCIQSNNVYGTEKNEKRKLTVHCPDPRYNNNPHTCPAKVEMHKSKLATKNWLAEVMTPMLRKDPSIGATAPGKKRSEIYGFEEKLPYMRLWTARMVALQNTNGTSVPEITPIPAENPARKKQVKKVVQPMSVPAKNTRSKAMAPSSNTRSKRRL
ncbi:hypothetical protein D1007_57239 [Hordeum vulgare]|nr:hypothetical protein D1007_57239 [Hordeum vulgare]